jgi:hypothetical protein
MWNQLAHENLQGRAHRARQWIERSNSVSLILDSLLVRNLRRGV